jgi:enterochelin esterase-like enzyme
MRLFRNPVAPSLPVLRRERPFGEGVTRTLRALASIVMLAAAASAAAGQSLTARTVRFQSRAFGGEATFAILVPPDYESSQRRYPVIYLLHGGTQNHTAFPARAWFAKEVSRRNVIVVMPHVPPFAYTMRSGGAPPAFEDFIAGDLVPYVDEKYRTVAKREARAIGGLSMGGFGAVLAGLRHPELFAIAGAFSGAFSGGRETMLATAVAALSGADAPFFYLACGVADPVLPAGRALVTLLEERGIAHEYREVPGAHTWDVWDPQTLAFLDVAAGRMK